MKQRKSLCLFSHASYVDDKGIEHEIYFKDNGYPLNVFRSSKRNINDVKKELQKEEPGPEPERKFVYVPEPEPERIEVPVKPQKSVHRFHPGAYEPLDGHDGF